MTLREEIRQEIIEAIYEGADHMNLPWRYPEPKPEEHTDAILALVREALTSRDAVEALTRTLVDLGNERAGIEDDTWPDDYNDIHVVVMMDESLKAITAALDAVTGEEH